MNYIIRIITTLSILLLIASCKNNSEKQLFDGNTLEGWEGDTDVFRVENGAIVGGFLDKSLAESHYLCSTKKYSDFELSLSVKFIDKDTIGNAGVSFRAKRVPGSTEVASYQFDLGYTPPKGITSYSTHTPKDMVHPFSLWGSLVDECRADTSRYPRPDWYPVVFLKIPERELIHKAVNHHDWNDVTIIAHGKQIELKANGITTAKFTETLDISAEGYICLQAHQGKPYEVNYKNIVIKELSN